MWWLVNRIVLAAHRHPYYHLYRNRGALYMRRWWLFGHGTERDRDNHGMMCNPSVGGFSRWLAKYVCARVHHIYASDIDRDLHDHPSWSVSVVLQGGYWEVVPFSCGSRYPFDGMVALGDPRCPALADIKPLSEKCIVRWRAPGSVVLRRATSRHLIVLPKETTSWSIFILGRKTNKWGFYTPVGKIPHRFYDAYKAADEASRPPRGRTACYDDSFAG